MTEDTEDEFEFTGTFTQEGCLMDTSLPLPLTVEDTAVSPRPFTSTPLSNDHTRARTTSSTAESIEPLDLSLSSIKHELELSDSDDVDEDVDVVDEHNDSYNLDNSYALTLKLKRMALSLPPNIKDEIEDETRITNIRHVKSEPIYFDDGTLMGMKSISALKSESEAESDNSPSKVESVKEPHPNPTATVNPPSVDFIELPRSKRRGFSLYEYLMTKIQQSIQARAPEASLLTPQSESSSKSQSVSDCHVDPGPCSTILETVNELDTENISEEEEEQPEKKESSDSSSDDSGDEVMLISNKLVTGWPTTGRLKNCYRMVVDECNSLNMTELVSEEFSLSS